MKRKTNQPPVIDLGIADDVHQILKPCPEVGEGVHHAILGAVSELALLGYSSEEIPEMVEEWVSASGTEPYPREIPDAIAKVFDCDGGDPRLENIKYSKTPTWSECSPFQTVLIAQKRGGSTELIQSSPYDVLTERTTEEWLDCFYRDHDLLSIGEHRRATEVKPLAKWRGHLEWATFIVPNTFKTECWGRCNTNVVTPRYFVLTEMDIAPSVGIWGMILKKYGTNHIDVQAGVICYLRDLGILRLATVVWSGGKSMHAYWYPDKDETINRSFMDKAVSLGADHAGWTLSQFARIAHPNKPHWQEILYLDPRNL